MTKLSRSLFCGLLTLTLGLALSGCASKKGKLPWAFGYEKKKKTVQANTTPAPSSDLRLFGQGNIGNEISFEGKAVANFVQHTIPGEGADFDPCVDRSGQSLVLASTRHARNSHLYVKPVLGATLTQITDGAANDAQPVYSPDGKHIAFTSDRDGQWDIWVIDADGRNPRQITNHPMPELHPSWSPDGKRLVYCRINPRQGRGELWISELENPGIKRLIGEGLFPTWSPRGNKIAYQRARARGSRWFSIWVMTIQNDEAMFPTEIAASKDTALIAPAWSPDGSQIAFASVQASAETEDGQGEPQINGHGRSDIGIVDADGQGLQLLTNGRGENYSPYWGADGRIYFTVKLDATETIWSLRPMSSPGLAPTEATPAISARRAAAIEPQD